MSVIVEYIFSRKECSLCCFSYKSDADHESEAIEKDDQGLIDLVRYQVLYCVVYRESKVVNKYD